MDKGTYDKLRDMTFVVDEKNFNNAINTIDHSIKKSSIITSEGHTIKIFNDCTVLLDEKKIGKKFKTLPSPHDILIDIKTNIEGEDKSCEWHIKKEFIAK